MPNYQFSSRSRCSIAVVGVNTNNTKLTVVLKPDQSATFFAPYEALMYLGLQVSPLYTEQVVKTGLSTQFQTYCGELNEGGKCSD